MILTFVPEGWPYPPSGGCPTERAPFTGGVLQIPDLPAIILSGFRLSAGIAIEPASGTRSEEGTVRLQKAIWGRAALAALAVIGLVTAWRTGVQAGGHERARAWLWQNEALAPGESYASAARHCDRRLAEMRAALRAHPDDPRLLLRMARYHWQRAQLLALEACPDATEVAQEPEPAAEAEYQKWMRAALARDATGDLREAARVVRRALTRERRPEQRWPLLRHLARTECARGRHVAELEALREGAAQRPRDPDVLERLARAYGEIGDPLAQERTLERLWRAQRSQGGQLAPRREAGECAGAPPPRAWLSPAVDGDAWMDGLRLHRG
jgi:tetratricopeptide (TPR) repeat protein